MKYIVALLMFFFVCKVAIGQVTLPRLVRDSMVLQRNTAVKIWGWCSAREKITISFLNKKYKTVGDANGNWQVILSPMKAGGPYSMKIDATNHVVINNILVGDVWICAGQSNMVHQLELHNITYATDIAEANYPQIRHFWINTTVSLQGPQADLPVGYWKPATPADVPRFSAVAYFFAKKIYDKYHVPIGLINASVGGTPIEAWTSEAGLLAFPNVVKTILQNKDTGYINTREREQLKNEIPPQPNDKGLAAATPWYDTGYVPKGWRNINIPGYWEDQGIKELDGIVWYRKEINLPASMAAMPAKMFLGRIVDADFLYINGKLAGNTTYLYPQRRYPLATGLLKPGRNIITIRVINNSGKGGFVPDKPYYLTAGKDTIDLKGYWQYKVGAAFTPHRNPRPVLNLQNQPAGLFNGMVAPVTNFAIKGILWYQGESNAGNAAAYAKLLPALIQDWRKQWNQGNVPFLYVQLPNYMEVNYLPSESDWALIREGQLKSLSVPNTGMAVAIDLGEWNDIHPDNKKDVGIRLAVAAEKIAYADSEVVYSGPVYQLSEISGNKINITFVNTGSGLITIDGAELNQFAIAGADKKFVWANAQIEGNKVVVWNDDVPHPLYVRYAWANNPAGANLYNKEGLPASPFRTDNEP